MPDQFLSLLDQRQDEIKALLPKYLTPERFFVLARMVQKDSNLRKCSAESLLECVMQAAQCGLELGTTDQHAFIIPYGNEAQFQPSYRGMIFRLVQAGVVASMYAETVCEKDPPPQIISGTRRELIHNPDYFSDRGKIVGAYSVAVMPSGLSDFEVIGPRDIEAIEKSALRISGGKPSPAWQLYRGEMIKKSVIKRHAKRLQGDRRGPVDLDEMDRLARTFEATARDLGEAAQPDDLPAATDGTKAPTPKKAAPPVEDRLLNDTEQTDAFDAWVGLGGQKSRLVPFLKKEVGVDDLAAVKLSQLEPMMTKMQEELAG